MNKAAEDRDLLVRFLLDDLDEERRQGIEERLFTDDGYFRALQLVEEDLIRDHLLSQLDQARQTLFIAKYSATRALVARVAKTRRTLLALGTSVGRLSWTGRVRKWFTLPISRGMVFATVATALVVLTTGTFWYSKRSGVPVKVSFVLLRGAQERGESIPSRLDIPRTAAVSFSVELPKYRDAASYRAVVSTPEGWQVWGDVVPASARSTDGAALSVKIPAGRLRQGDYVLSLQAPGAVGYQTFEDYAFSVGPPR